MRTHFGAGPHEKLSGVDLLKRCGPTLLPGNEGIAPETPTDAHALIKSSETFPSTSHLAALPFLHALNTLEGEGRRQAEQWKKAYIAELQQIQKSVPFELDILPQEYQGQHYWQKIFSLDAYDSALLFPKRFPDVVGDTQAYQTAQTAFQKAVTILEDFFHQIHLRPTPYYVLLAADGDSMGTVIDWQGQGKEGMQRHQRLSTALATFARQTKDVVRQHKGVCIYSGGDDVLALLPLHEAIACAQILAENLFAQARLLATGRREGAGSV